LDLVEHVEARWHLCFDRVLGQYPLRVAVQRGDGRDVGLLERRDAALPRFAARLDRPPLERGADPISQLCGGRFGERDGRDVLQLDTRDNHEVDDAIDDRGGLARPRARFDEQRVVEPLDSDELARVGIDELDHDRHRFVRREERLLALVGFAAATTHCSLSLSRTGPRNATNDSFTGSSCLACQCAPRSRGTQSIEIAVAAVVERVEEVVPTAGKRGEDTGLDAPRRWCRAPRVRARRQRRRSRVPIGSRASRVNQ
jgi:hypothetical protein